MSADAELRIAAKLMATRLKLFRTLVEQARERGDSRLDLALEEVWEREDEAALQAFDAALLSIQGARPLFPEATHV